ncbi:MAG: SHOCT domain-containing protein [Haloplanus sp.]
MASSDLDIKTVVLLLVAAVILLPLLTMGMGFGGMMGSGMWGGQTTSGWWLLAGLLGRVLTLLVVVGVGYLIYRALIETDDSGDDALEELRLAYARGDLSDEEFERRRETLKHDDTG